MVKLIENTYRQVNIAMVNELAILSNMLDIDIWEVVDAAKTKPFGFNHSGPDQELEVIAFQLIQNICLLKHDKLDSPSVLLN